MTTRRRTMWRIKTHNYFFLTSFLYFSAHLKGSYPCPLRVGYPRVTLNNTVGDSLTLNCTVLYCAAEQPEVYWCKYHANSCQQLNATNRSIKNIHNMTERGILVVYTISSVNLTDSGSYQCHAKEGDVQANGNSIIVNVFETSANSTMKTQNPLGTPIWIFYSIIVVGILGTVLFLVLITYFCIRNFNEPGETREPVDSCGRHECHAMTVNNGKPTIYENMNGRPEGSTTPNSLTVNDCNNPANHGTDAFDDGSNNPIIYASLNTSMLCRKASVTAPDEDTEYAAINIKH
ncbi:uncharacterized protein LOC119977707 isoform X2 [Scyliorhinus canicula]|uniref:uncharacterized protein LOC119977707 isoform X2 n=1 Tax=Scyliorhinus canicula TaxID=7830 RepID=UPI0018F465A0|nr:uncharacterized protein LOC119977707 isoform X2 [Scyliorhinus canicula]